MIASALILPTENPVSVNDIKRTLATFDKVFISSPDDREFIPPNVYENVLFNYFGLPPIPIFGMSNSPVRPLGKVNGFHEQTEISMDECRDAIQQGLVEMLPAPRYSRHTTLGGPSLPPDTPNPIFTYRNYRSLAENQEFVNAMAIGLEKLDLGLHDAATIAPGGIEDIQQTVNGVRQVPPALISSYSGLRHDENVLLSRIAHARIGSTVKFLGYCHNKKITPFTTDKGMAKFIAQLEYNFVGKIREITADREAIMMQKRINSLEQLVFEEFIDDAKFQSLSVKQVLRLRTKSWGKAYKAKTDLICSINTIAKDVGHDNDKFQNASRLEINRYKKQIADYRDELERINLSFTLRAGFGASAYAWAEGSTLFDTMLKAPSFELLIGIAAAAAFPFAKNFVDQLVDYIDLMDKERDIKHLPGYAIYNHYRYLT